MLVLLLLCIRNNMLVDLTRNITCWMDFVDMNVFPMFAMSLISRLIIFVKVAYMLFTPVIYYFDNNISN